MTGKTYETLAARLAAQTAQPRALIAIDGHSAAGKTTLSNQIKATTHHVQIVRTDDFYRVMNPEARAQLDAQGGYQHDYDWQRLREQVLKPLRAGKNAVYEKYDWHTNTLKGKTQVKATGIIVVEGCYSARPELRDYFDAIIIVTAPLAQRMATQKERDDAWEWVERWHNAERYYITTHQPESYASLVWRRL